MNIEIDGIVFSYVVGGTPVLNVTGVIDDIQKIESGKIDKYTIRHFLNIQKITEIKIACESFERILKQEIK